MKKILFYTDTPMIGGAEHQIYLLAKFLDKEKFEIILVCSNYKSLNKWCEKFEKEGVDVKRLKVKHKHDPAHYSGLKRVLKKENPDIVHLHIWNPASCRYAFYAASSLGIPIVTTEHDPFKLGLIKDLIKKRSLKKTSKIITVSKQNKELLSELYPKYKDQIKVIHNGIDITWWRSQILRFSSDEKGRIKKNIFYANEDSLIITCVAELHERKGQKFLLKSMPRLTEDFPNIKLVLIGEGGDRKNLENLVQKLNLKRHVAIIGRQKKIPKLLKSSDIFVLPSKREAFGLVNLEAMITPLPVIASKVGGIPEIIEDGKNGILVEAKSAENIEKALRDLIVNKDKRASLAENGQKTVEENFCAEKMAQKYENIYLEITK
ncbi:glycosyltransferase [Candidatus Peregrinibacteria bacterium]|nr:glycosyltransferase [Candidatus Peregrinibacteria bacterium]